MVTITAPSKVSINSSSQLGPFSIPAGQSKIFTIDFTIASDATEADNPLNVILHFDSGDQILDPDAPDTSLDTSVNFIIDRTSPKINLTDDDFHSIPEGGVTDTTQITVSGNDLAADGSTPGSGVAAITLKQDKNRAGDPGIYSQSQDFPAFPTSESAFFPLGGGSLPEGDYTATVKDRVGNERTKKFTILRRYIEVLDDNNAVIPDKGARKTTGLTLQGPAVAVNFTLDRLDSAQPTQIFPAVPLSAHRVQASAPQVDEGRYAVSDFDAFGLLVASQTITVDRTAPGLNVYDQSLRLIPNGRASQTFSVNVSANDGAKGSGVDKILLTQVQGGAYFSSAAFAAGTTEGAAGFPKDAATGGRLAEGVYTAKAVDSAANESAVSFTVDRTPPSVMIVEGPSVSSGGRNLGPYQGDYVSAPLLWLHNAITQGQPVYGITFNASDPGAGFGSLSVGRSVNGAPATNVFSQSAPASPGFAMTTGVLDSKVLSDGFGYSLSAADTVGNQTGFNFAVDSVYPKLENWTLSVTNALRVQYSLKATDETSGFLTPPQFLTGAIDLNHAFPSSDVGPLSVEVAGEIPQSGVFHPAGPGSDASGFNSVLAVGDASGLSDIYGHLSVVKADLGASAFYPGPLANGVPYKFGTEGGMGPFYGYFGSRLNRASLNFTCATGECVAGGVFTPLANGCMMAPPNFPCGDVTVKMTSDDSTLPQGAFPPELPHPVPLTRQAGTVPGTSYDVFTQTEIRTSSCPVGCGVSLRGPSPAQASQLSFSVLVRSNGAGFCDPEGNHCHSSTTPYGSVSYWVDLVDGFAIANPAKVKVSPGLNVSASFGGLKITLASVSGDNNIVTASATKARSPNLQAAPGTDPPGDPLPPQAYDITATNYQGPVTVTAPFKPSAVTPEQLSRLGLYHLEDNRWVNITTEVDPVNGLVTGVASHLSLFALFLDMGGTGDGQAVGLDNAGHIWEVAQDRGEFKLAQYDSQTNLLTATVLPDAAAQGTWTIRFDPQQNAYAVGVASGPSTIGGQLSVYKVSPQGLLVSSAAFSAGFDAQAQALDSTGDIWITGLTLQGSSQAGGALMGLWKYCFHNNTLTQKATFTRHGGLDAGMGIRLDPGGHIWISGFSRNPNQHQGTPPVDLALWEYDQTGQLLKGPILRPGYMASTEGNISAKLEISASTIFVAATRQLPAGTAMDVTRFDLNGDWIDERSWTSPEGAAVPRSMTLDGQGNVVIAGGVFSASAMRLALWRYDPSGGFLGSATIPGAQDARGLAFNGTDAWLAVAASSVPYRLPASDILPGTEAPAPPGPTGGLAVAVDGSGNRWEVVEDNGFFKLAKYGTDGALLSAAVLPNGSESFGDWTLSLDAAGAPVAVGASQNPTTGGTLLTAYRADPASGVLLSSAVYSGQAVAFDSTGGSWITGAASLDGQSFSLALFKFDPAQNLITLTTTFSRGAGIDFGLGVKQESNGNIWVVGYSSNPAAAGPAHLDLGLWKFDPSGAALSSGPYFRPGYEQNAEQALGAKLAVSAGGVYAAAMRASDLGNQDLAFLRYDLSGSLLSEQAWRASPAADAVPLGMKFDASGNIEVSGSLEGAAAFRPGLWRYDASANFLSAQTFAGFTTANDLAFSGPDLWLAVDASSAPYLFQGGAALSGTNIIYSSGTPSSPPPPILITSIDPSTGPIGIPFSVSGSSFGVYNGGNTRLKIGGYPAALSVWNDTNIQGTIPGALSTGTYPVIAERVDSGGALLTSNTVYFTVTVPQVSTFTPVSGPIGVPFSLTGTSFGPYNGGNTRVRIGGALAPLSVWNDTSIQGTIPGISTGTQALLVERTAEGGLSESATVYFTVTMPSVTVLSPASGPIGAAFTLTGRDFGPYNGANTRVLVGGAAAALSVWNDTTISGTIPGSLSPGPQGVTVQRLTADGGLIGSATIYFQVTGLYAASLSPSTGPIGIPFTITGTSFGTYNGGNTRVKFGTTAAALSVWNDTTISGTVPGLSTGTYNVVVERQDGANVAQSNATSFVVQFPQISTVTPLSGPIGVPFTVSGSGFGPYNGSNTRVRIGGALAPLSVWNDTTIAGTLPGISTGSQPFVLEWAASDGGLMTSPTLYFSVAVPSVTALSPATGPIGAAFTLTGHDFGPYNGTNTRVLVGGTAAALSVWNDTTITGTIPGSVNHGPQAIVVQRLTEDGGLSASCTVYFQVTGLYAGSIYPSTGPIGIPFTITGTSFGSYNGSNTRVKFGTALAPLSVWNDTTISGTIPGLSTGTYSVIVEIQSGANVSQSGAAVFTVQFPHVSTATPLSGPIGVPFTVTGSGFGPYSGSNTRVRIGGALAPLSVWNDTAISGTIPGISTGSQPFVIEWATGDGGLMAAPAQYFDVALPSVTAVSPASGPVGTAFTLTGHDFGPYNGNNTRVLVGGVASALSVWNDTTIVGTVPGSLTPGSQGVTVQRLTADGGLVGSDTVYFQVTGIIVSSVNPSTGPIGIPFAITGTSFGSYNGSNTRVKFGTVSAPLSVWNDTTIAGTIPGLSTGTYNVVVEIQSGANVSQSGVSVFTVQLPQIATLVPSSAPIGAPFTLTGTSFGPYNGSYTQVLIGGVSAPLSVWNDTTISGTVPGSLPAGSQSIVVQRTAPDSGSASSASQAFTVVAPVIENLSPSQGPTGTGFTLTGNGFGPYAGGATQVLVGGTPASLSYWTDVEVRGLIPDGLADGAYSITVVRSPSGGLASSNAVQFTVGQDLGPASLRASAGSVHPARYYQAALPLTGRDGGKVEAESRAAVTVPVRALESTTTITIDMAPDEPARKQAQYGQILGVGGDPVEFGPEGTRFLTPVTIELSYISALVPAGNAAPRIHYWDRLAKTWRPLETELDAAHRKARAKTDHFSLYQLLVPGVYAPEAVNGNFAFGALRVYPNPARRGQTVTIRVQAGRADLVEYKIMSMFGQLIENATVTGSQIIDDGNGVGPQWTFDYNWDTSRVGSGVYLVVITARKSGQGEIRKSAKVAVIR